MKLLVIVSSLDLTQPFSATPAWWQFLKALYEVGVDLIVTPYQGPAIESPWWRAAPNPARLEGDVFKLARDTIRRFTGVKQSQAAGTQIEAESLSDRLVRRIAQTVIAPRWRRHVDRLLRQHPDVDAVLVITVPLNHLSGLAHHITERYHKPVFFYDGDVPASLPNFMGFATGFRFYQGADLSEYTAFFSNSEGGRTGLRELGAREVHTLFYGADEAMFSPLDVPQDIDAFFYGHGREYRGEWIDAMVREPSLKLPGVRFAVRGTNLGDLGRAEMLPYLSLSKLREYACRSKINLVITRKAHASVFASSSSRPFELAAMRACMVCNPYEGIETWFEPEKELIVVHSAGEAMERYTWLLGHDERPPHHGAGRSRALPEGAYLPAPRPAVCGDDPAVPMNDHEVAPPESVVSAQAFQMALDTPWRVRLEIRRLLSWPVARILFALGGSSVGARLAILWGADSAEAPPQHAADRRRAATALDPAEQRAGAVPPGDPLDTPGRRAAGDRARLWHDGRHNLRRGKYHDWR